MTTDEAKPCQRLSLIARSHPRWGYKMAHQLLRREGWRIKLSAPSEVRRPQNFRKWRRVHLDSPERLSVTHPNHVWAIDFQVDETADYQRLKLANVVDEFTWESRCPEVDRSITADHLHEFLERLMGTHGGPEHLRRANGPELISWALRDGCRLGQIGTLYIEARSSWEHPLEESFNSRSRTSSLTSRRLPISGRPESLSKPGG